MNAFIPKVVLVIFIHATLTYSGAGPQAFAQENVMEVAITAMSGEVLVLKKEATDWQPANPGDTLREGDAIKTLAGAKVRLQFPLRGTIDLNENTQMAINLLEAAEGGKTETSLVKGKIRTKIEGLLSEKSKFEVRTPTAVTGVVGTEFYLDVYEGSETISEGSQIVTE